MFVKIVSGRDAGQMVDMNYIDAKELLNDGRAVLAYPPEEAAQFVKENIDENQNAGNDSDAVSRRKGRNKRRP
jgi:hypothetical protein